MARQNMEHKQNNLECYVCGKKTPDSQMSKLHFWNHYYCNIHKSDGTPRCCNCNRYKAQGGLRYINLPFDRKLCSDCHSVAIMDDQKCEIVIHVVYKFFKALNLKVNMNIPILLVDRDEMNKNANKGNIGPPNLTYCGLTTCSERTVNRVTRCLQRGEDIVAEKDAQKLMRHKVTSILLLFGMSNVTTGATLAHEILHTWFKYEGYKKWENNVEEGMCEVISQEWLEWLGFIEGDSSLCSPTEQAQFVSKLREYEWTRIGWRTEDGFREAKRAVENFGLEATLKHIVKKGRLPQ